jgi:hypothetical protein
MYASMDWLTTILYILKAAVPHRVPWYTIENQKGKRVEAWE